MYRLRSIVALLGLLVCLNQEARAVTKVDDFYIEKSGYSANGDVVYVLTPLVKMKDKDGSEHIALGKQEIIFRSSLLEQKKRLMEKGTPEASKEVLFINKYLERISEINNFERSSVTVKKLPFPKEYNQWLNPDGSVKAMNPVQAQRIRNAQQDPEYEFTFYKKQIDINGYEFTAVSETMIITKNKLTQSKITAEEILKDSPYDEQAHSKLSDATFFLEKIEGLAQ